MLITDILLVMRNIFAHYSENEKLAQIIEYFRCARYTAIPSSCVLVADPADPTCCKVPECPVVPTGGPTPTPGFIPTPLTPQPGVLTGLAPVITPTPGITLRPPQLDGRTTLAPQPKTGILKIKLD